MQLGYGWFQAPASGNLGLLGVRGGVTFISGPVLLTAGAVVQAPLPEALAFGPELELTHLGSGLWISPGLVVGVDGHLGLTGAVGWSVVGVEGRIFDAETSEPTEAVLLRVRIPIGLIALALAEQKADAAR